MFALSIAFPMSIVSFVALVVGAGVVMAGGYAFSAALTFGVFAGSFLWWVVLSGLIGVLRERVNDRTLAWVSGASALMIAGFALWIGFGLVQAA